MIRVASPPVRPAWKAALALMRPHHYVKNVFVFAPLFFAAQFADPSLLFRAAEGFLAFCFTASAVYVFNDLKDIERDRSHPKKRFRPLASGEVSKPMAWVILAALLVGGLGLGFAINYATGIILAAYLAINFAYNLILKHVSILELAIVSLGYNIRLMVGSAVTGVPLSMWVIVMTFLLALFLTLAKRRDDVLIYERTGNAMRPVVSTYNSPFINASMLVMAAVLLVAYTLYTISTDVVQRLGTPYLYLTVFFVILGVLRYFQVTFVEERSGDPTKIALTDPFLQVTLLGWIASFAWILYV